MSETMPDTMEINGETLLYGIFGDPLGQSLSPDMHNAAFLELGINAIYVPFNSRAPQSSWKECLIDLQNFRGASITIPHKSWACRLADERDPLSRACGAANTLIRSENDKLLAYNTDGPGALKALRTSMNLKGKRFLILGYGGSAAAIAYALLFEGIQKSKVDTNENIGQLFIAGRNSSRAQKFVAALQGEHSLSENMIAYGDFDSLKSEDVDAIINTTPLGMKGQATELPLPAEFIKSNHTVFDIVYNPLDTPLTLLATERNATIVRGYLMLLYQAVLQFELFTKHRAPIELMENVILQKLENNGKI